MRDPWMDRLSDYIDGDLDDAERSALRAHLETCTECSTTIAELRTVIGAARQAPVIEPQRDLWPAIHAGLGAREAAPADAAAWPPRQRAQRRRFSFSTPQLAAAAVLLMALSGTTVWLATNGPAVPVPASGTIIQSAGDRSATTVSTPPQQVDYSADIAALERALDENSAGLDPATVEVVQRSLESIDRAIDDARAALEADPGNPFLHRQLDNTMRRKIDVLRRATGARRGQS